MTTETNTPAAKIRDGSLEVSIWKNETEKGIRYTVDGITRSYKLGDEWKKTKSLSNGEILRSARLLELAYTRITEFRKTDKFVEDHVEVIHVT